MIRLRPLDIEDLAQVGLVEASAGLTPWAVDDYRHALLDARWLCLGAFQCSDEPAVELVGCLLGQVLAPEAELARLAVCRHRQNEGIGGRLWNVWSAAIIAQGCTVCFLEVRSANLAATRFYQRAGFQSCGRRRGYYRNPPDDAVLMKCILQGSNSSSPLLYNSNITFFPG